VATRKLTVSTNGAGGGVLATWEELSDGDVGEALGLAGHNDKTVTIVGTATSFALEGSNDGVNWFTLHDIDMTTTITTAGIFTIKENPVYIRPNLTTGTVVVSIVAP
jgi:hypothetical protein